MVAQAGMMSQQGDHSLATPHELQKKDIFKLYLLVAEGKRQKYKSDCLKEQCPEDFAILGQFCAKIVTLRL